MPQGGVSDVGVSVDRMVRKIEELRATPDETLIAEHDSRAGHTLVGTDYYVQELDRRSRERSAEASNRLAMRSYWMALASTALAAVATVAAVLALFLR
ncbi:hypothetical protein SAMN05216418_1800 [Microbacterium enclense]|uniref:Uncharacterized protein n=2 Tax=Microbacterium enclense TaxID=993073 RepID=A0A1G6JE70_9MICO|nr:hypothetical protein SAMN05216418_1800 [Microbacterium enclense]